MFPKLSGTDVRGRKKLEDPYFPPKIQNLKMKKNFMAPFYGWSSTASRLGATSRRQFNFTTMFPEIPDTHFIDLRRMKG